MFIKGQCPVCGNQLVGDFHLRRPQGAIRGVGTIWCNGCGATWCDCCGAPLDKKNEQYFLELSEWKQPFGLSRKVIKVKIATASTGVNGGRNENK